MRKYIGPTLLALALFPHVTAAVTAEMERWQVQVDAVSTKHTVDGVYTGENGFTSERSCMDAATSTGSAEQLTKLLQMLRGLDPDARLEHLRCVQISDPL